MSPNVSVYEKFTRNEVKCKFGWKAAAEPHIFCYVPRVQRSEARVQRGAER